MLVVFKSALLSPHVLGTYPDVWVTLWSLDHVSHFPQLPLYTTSHLFAPNGSLLVLHNLTESVGVMASILGMSSPEHYNALCVLIFGINFLCAVQLLSGYSSSRFLCYACSLLFVFHPYNLAHLDAGHLNLISSFPLLVVWIGITKIVQEKPLATQILASGIFLAVFTDWYILYFCMASVGLMGVSMAWSLVLSNHAFNRTHLKKLASGALIGLLLGSYKIFLALAYSQYYTGHHSPARHSLNLVHLIYPTNYQLIRELGQGIIPDLPQAWDLVNDAESAAYSGLALLMVFAVLSIRNWRSCDYLFWFTLLMAGISCGPEIRMANMSLLPNPFFLLTYCLPVPLPVPARAYVLTLLLGLLHIVNQTEKIRTASGNNSIKKLAIPFISLLILVEFIPISPKLSPLPQEPLLYRLRTMDIDILVDTGQPELATFRSLLHNKPISAGFLARRPKAGQRAHRTLMRKLRDCAPSRAQAIIVERQQIELIDRFNTCALFEHAGSSEHLSIWIKKTN